MNFSIHPNLHPNSVFSRLPSCYLQGNAHEFIVNKTNQNTTVVKFATSCRPPNNTVNKYRYHSWQCKALPHLALGIIW